MIATDDRGKKSNEPALDFTIANSFKSLTGIPSKLVMLRLGKLFAFPVDSELINEIMKSMKHPKSFIVIKDKGKMIFMMTTTILFFIWPSFCASMYSFLKFQLELTKSPPGMDRKSIGNDFTWQS